MVNMALLNLILYNFLEHHIKWVTILNCWSMGTQSKLTEMLMAKSMYVQLWNINRMDIKDDIEGRYLSHNKLQIGVFFDFNCLESAEVLNKTSQEKLFKHHFHWLIYDEEAGISKFRQLFEHFNMAVDADVTYVFPNQSLINMPGNSSYITYDVYNNGYYLGGKLNMTADRELLCSHKDCKLKQYLSSLHEKTKNENRWFLGDITMRVTTVITHIPLTEPAETILEYLGSKGDMHIDGLARFGFNYLMILKDNLGCQFVYNFTNGWSDSDLTGGCVGALGIDQSADLSSSPFLTSRIRLEMFLATMPLGSFRQVCIFRTPRNAGIRGDVYLEPFSCIVWLIFGAILLLIGALLWFTFAVECRQLQLYLEFLPSLLSSCLISFGSACCQGSFLVPSSVGGRMTFISLSLLTFIIYNYYTSIVVAILLGSPVKSDIKTIGQLAESNLDVAFEPIRYTRIYLNISPLPEIHSLVRNKVQSKKNPDSVWLPIPEGLRRVRDEPGFVYGTESFSSFGLIEQSYTAEEICDLNEILLRPMQNLYTHVHRNSSYGEMVKLKQVRILESGLDHRLQNIWVKNSLNCYLSSGSLVQVGLEYTAPLFIMLAGVYVLAAILLLLEIWWSKYVEGRKIEKLIKRKN